MENISEILQRGSEKEKQLFVDIYLENLIQKIKCGLDALIFKRDNPSVAESKIVDKWFAKVEEIDLPFDTQYEEMDDELRGNVEHYLNTADANFTPFMEGSDELDARINHLTTEVDRISKIDKKEFLDNISSSTKTYGI